ncbi:MAG: FtsX-like permease family protein, partial [Flavobacteriales bacterium]|nr:FtsX-like permease family protein [Flavobacteriales bacterium]
GLYGLVAFMALQRTREIGIRRVMGATEFSLIKLLSVEFIWLVIVAIAIAFPLTWLLIDYWQSYFAYAMSLQWSSFIIGGLAAFLLAMFITTVRALVASKANPVETI